jgi:hypothetical protein
MSQVCGWGLAVPARQAVAVGQDGDVPRPVPRHDRDAGGPADVLAAKAGLREEVWTAMSAARVARFPGAAGRIPNFTGAEAAAERLRALPEWRRAHTLNLPFNLLGRLIKRFADLVRVCPACRYA